MRRARVAARAVYHSPQLKEFGSVGALTQGGTELDFEFQTITRETVQVVQGLIILFSGALAYLFAPWLARALAPFLTRKGAAA